MKSGKYLRGHLDTFEICIAFITSVVVRLRLGKGHDGILGVMKPFKMLSVVVVPYFMSFFNP